MAARWRRLRGEPIAWAVGQETSLRMLASERCPFDSMVASEHIGHSHFRSQLANIVNNMQLDATVSQRQHPASSKGQQETTTNMITTPISHQIELKFATSTTSRPHKQHKTRRRPLAGPNLTCRRGSPAAGANCCSTRPLPQDHQKTTASATMSANNHFARFCLFVGQLLLICCQFSVPTHGSQQHQSTSSSEAIQCK